MNGLNLKVRQELSCNAESNEADNPQSRQMMPEMKSEHWRLCWWLPLWRKSPSLSPSTAIVIIIAITILKRCCRILEASPANVFKRLVDVMLTSSSPCSSLAMPILLSSLLQVTKVRSILSPIIMETRVMSHFQSLLPWRFDTPSPLPSSSPSPSSSPDQIAAKDCDYSMLLASIEGTSFGFSPIGYFNSVVEILLTCLKSVCETQCPISFNIPFPFAWSTERPRRCAGLGVDRIVAGLNASIAYFKRVIVVISSWSFQSFNLIRNSHHHPHVGRPWALCSVCGDLRCRTHNSYPWIKAAKAHPMVRNCYGHILPGIIHDQRRHLAFNTTWHLHYFDHHSYRSIDLGL